MREGLSGEVDNIVTYLIVTCYDETFVSAADRVRQRKFLQATVTFILKVKGVNDIINTLKSRNSVAASTVPVTVVYHTLRQNPMCLARRKRHLLKAPWSLTIPWSFASFTSS